MSGANSLILTPDTPRASCTTHNENTPDQPFVDVGIPSDHSDSLQETEELTVSQIHVIIQADQPEQSSSKTDQVHTPEESSQQNQTTPGQECATGNDDHDCIEGSEKDESLFSFVISIWSLIIKRTFFVTFIATIAMWIFYLPALVIPIDILEEHIEPVLYVHIREVIARSINMLTLLLILHSVFGYERTKSTIYCYWPTLYVLYLLHYLVEVVLYSVIPFFGILLVPFIIYSMIIYIYFDYKRNHSDQDLTIVKNDCEVSAKLIMAGIAAFISFQFIVRYFTRSNFPQKMLIRFIIFPIMSFGVNNILLLITKNKIHNYQKFISIVEFSRYHLQYTSRSMLTSISHNPLSYRFVLFCFLASVAKCFNRLTIKRQNYASRRVIMWVRSFFRLIRSIVTCKNEGKKPAVTSMYLLMEEEAEPNKTIKRNSRRFLSKTEQKQLFDEEFRQIRAIHIVEGVQIDMQTMITTPLMFYLANRLFLDEGLNLIGSFTECVVQICAQLIFEFVTNTFLFIYESRYLHIPIKGVLMIENGISFWLRFLFILGPILYIHFIFYVYY